MTSKASSSPLPNSVRWPDISRVLDNPAHDPRFADIGYYASFAPLCDRYPCHLHINLDERYRNRGIGSALIAAFAAQAASAGRLGIHVVTG
jgi:GNAT superfamily N-acetyltransferase